MKLILCGACGRMGKTVAECAEQNEIICGVDLYPSPMPFPVYASFSEITEQADAVIDFSSASGLAERLEYCAKHKLPIVLAATGYTAEDEEVIAKYAKKIAVFKTGNLSLGVNVLQLLVKKAAAILEDFDVEIIERHHNQKKDAPSGTALMLANSVNEGYENSKEFIYGRHGVIGARDKKEIGIHAVRGGSIVGEHEVMFAGTDEIITLSHSARSRKVFATGALKAAKCLIGKPAGLYDMNDMLAGIV
ncbi:MAG: 4-hydroxy-tetrahydrodipicolinate reductase [Clostridia bacterium]|nr:4-hydroxy-tetrahydrodipicolinate reductase [Clostridia bacterium]